MPTATPTDQASPTATMAPVVEADLEAGLQQVREFLAGLAAGEYRQVYGDLLTTAGQQRMADLVLGRLALPNPHISYFELLGAEPEDGRVSVEVTWEESYEGQGVVGSQDARILLARQDSAFLVDDIVLGEYQPAATPVPPPLPRAEALTNPAIPGDEMRFRASGFENGERVLAWLELPDGSLTDPEFYTTNGEGAFEVAYSSQATQSLEAGRWIWWAQALRDSSRNTGISVEVLEPPTPTPRPTRPPVVAAPTRAPQPTPVPQPSTAYGPPALLWPEVETSRESPGVLVVEFVPVAEQLADNEFYELVLVARDPQGNVYNAGAVRSKGDTCSSRDGRGCASVSTDQGFMRFFYPSGFEGQGTWFVQVVRQAGPDQFEPVSPPSESRLVILKPRD